MEHGENSLLSDFIHGRMFLFLAVAFFVSGAWGACRTCQNQYHVSTSPQTCNSINAGQGGCVGRSPSNPNSYTCGNGVTSFFGLGGKICGVACGSWSM